MPMKCIPPIPHFYIVKLGFAGVYLFFFCPKTWIVGTRKSRKNRLGEAVLTCTLNRYFCPKTWIVGTRNRCFEQNKNKTYKKSTENVQF